jgi:hypothetical protein
LGLLSFGKVPYVEATRSGTLAPPLFATEPGFS